MRKMTIKKLVSACLVGVALVVTLGGCAIATGPGFQAIETPSAGQGQVYVYRAARFYGAVINYKMSFSGAGAELDLPNGTWYRFEVAPGNYSASMYKSYNTESCGAVRFNVAAGETVFVENWAFVAASVGLVNTIACRVKIQEKELALKALADTKRLN
jgi:hypothetical protein